jgi:membrane-bound lytic murein transglycosylase D
MKWKVITFFVLALMMAECVDAAPVEESNFPSLVAAVRVKGPLDFCGEAVPMDTQEIRERYEKELLLTLWDRAQAILWLKRSRRYFPDVEKMLREERMPEDLKYVMVVESALRAHAGSSKGAMGFWQFTKSTGRKYGLEVNPRIDERRNLFASTQAAIRYLRELKQKFGSWTLAAAAYNMGEEGLMAEILEQDTMNYYELYLPLETQRFIFRVLCVKMILSHPEKFGFNLAEEDYYPPVEYDSIQLECRQETPLRIVAQAGRTHFKAIKDLNPQIRGHYLPVGTHELLIPKGSAAGFKARYSELMERFLAGRKESVYIVKEGDNLSSIAEKFGVPLLSLLIWNRLDVNRPIHAGDRLFIHQEQEAAGSVQERAGGNPIGSDDD